MSEVHELEELEESDQSEDYILYEPKKPKKKKRPNKSKPKKKKAPARNVPDDIETTGTEIDEIECRWRNLWEANTSECATSERIKYVF